MVIRKVPVYKFNVLDLKPITNGKFLKSNFYIFLPVLPSSFGNEKVLLEIPGALTIRVINRSYNDGSEDNRSIHSEGCFYFNEEKEWILEAICRMQTDDEMLKHNLTVRLPLSAPFVKDTRIGIYYDGTWVRFLNEDGEVLNQDSGVDAFCLPEGKLYLDQLMKEATVSKVSDVTVNYKEIKTNADAGCLFPYWWNADIGDVMNFYHDGVYHLIYLFDRKHHGSGPCGSHSIYQLTSENLLDWYEQKPIFEINKPWQTCGTGTMFFKDGKYYMSYGFHTERYKNGKQKIAPVYDREKQEFKPITFSEVFKKGALPAGATYSYSDDGVNFIPSEILFHSSRNPSGYTDKEGNIVFYCGSGANGVFKSTDMQKPFKKSNLDFNLISPVMKNSTECPAFFEWNGYKYLIVGFSGYFRTLEKNSEKFVDVAALGEEIYDGLSVPMVSEFGDNRRLIAGWIRSPLGWGGALMQRELVQLENGKLDMKWIPELIPQTDSENLAENVNLFESAVELKKGESYLFETTIDSLDAEKAAISLNDGNSACTIELDFIAKTVQVNQSEINCFADSVPTMLEAAKNADDKAQDLMRAGITNIPPFAKNYKLSDAFGRREVVTFKMILRRSKRLRSTVLDVELARRKTMISVRNDFFPTALSALSKGAVKLNKTKLAKFDYEE